MARYLIKRLLLMIPTLWIISVLAFLISHSSPIDPVNSKCNAYLFVQPYAAFEACEKREIAKFNLDKPGFYFSLTSLADPGNLYTISSLNQRRAAERLLHETGNWEKVAATIQQLKSFYLAHDPRKVKRIATDSLGLEPARQRMRSLHPRVLDLLSVGIPDTLEARLHRLEGQYSGPYFTELQLQYQTLSQTVAEMQRQSTRWKSYVPRIHWHGFECQYHIWLRQVLLAGDFGYSTDDRKISSTIGDLFTNTALFALFSTILVFLIGIPLGMLAALYRDQWFDRGSGIVLFAMRAVPEFWLATLLLMFFANPDRLDWFLSSFNSSDSGFVADLRRITLPLIAYTYGSLAGVSRTLRISMLDTLNEDYIRTAKAKGLARYAVWIKHGLRNALLPMVTLFVGLFPALLSGSVVLETIFQIPGLGNKIFNSILINDMPFLMAVFTLMGLLTMIGFFVADILYAWLDPRIRLTEKR